MKHVFGAAAMAVGLFAISSFGMTQVAEAGQIKIEVNDSPTTGYWGANGGGEFKVTTFSGSDSFVPTPVFGNGVANVKYSDGIFQTFCLERNEGINTTDTYDFTISDSAVAGGISGGSPDPLDPEKHWGLFNVDRTPKRVMRNRYPELVTAGLARGSATEAGAVSTVSSGGDQAGERRCPEPR